MLLTRDESRALELLDAREVDVDLLRPAVARHLLALGLIDADGSVTAAGAAAVEEVYARRFADGVAEMKARIRHHELGHPGD